MRTVAVVGSGITGTALAYHLAQAGHQVDQLAAPPIQYKMGLAKHLL